MTTNEAFDEKFKEAIEALNLSDLASEDVTKSVKNLKTLSECHPPLPEPAPEPDPVPTTTWGKVMAGTAKVWDNETTRVLIKSGGALVSVALVAYSTIHKDHVIERQALAQANQRSA